MRRIRSHQIHQSSYRRKLLPRPKDAYKASLAAEMIEELVQEVEKRRPPAH